VDVNRIETFPITVEVNCGWGDAIIVVVGLPDAAVKESRDRVNHVTPRVKQDASRRFRCAGLCGFHEFDLLRIEDLKMSPLIVKKDRLAVRADHQIIRVGNNERLLVSQHDPNRLKRVGLHQFFDLIRDHSLEFSRGLCKKQPSNLPVLRLCWHRRKNRIALAPSFTHNPPMLARALSAAVNHPVGLRCRAAPFWPVSCPPPLSATVPPFTTQPDINGIETFPAKHQSAMVGTPHRGVRSARRADPAGPLESMTDALPYPVELEANSAWRATLIVLVGPPNPAVEDSRDRATTALTNSGFKLPIRHSTINLAPADASIFDQSYDEQTDMAEVKGQESVKRALEIAAADGHNALMLYPITLQAKKPCCSPRIS
jgi:hypothetical protein